MQTKRLFEIMYTLINKKSVPAKELAAQFGVSSRTIYRDIDTLSIAGIPVYAERGKGGGISLLPNFVLNKSLLSEREQNEILTALHGLSKIKSDHVLHKMSAIFNKTADDWLEVDFSAWGGANNAVIFDSFKSAILERRVAEFDYYNQYGLKTFRRIEPVKLWFKSHSWYVTGFCITKQDTRMYKLTRVENLVITDEHFAKREPTPVADTGTPQQTTVIRFRIAPEMAYRVFDYFGENSVEKQPDGSYIAQAAWGEDNWVYGFILSFGEHIKVLEPEHIGEIIKNKAQKIVENYL